MSAANPFASTHAPGPVLKLNIGAGKSELPGHESIDIKSGIDAAKLPHADESVDEIYASHVLEHWPYEQTLQVLAEWVRVLKPGGRLRVSVPDFDLLVKAYTQGTALPVEGMILGGHVDEHDHHKALFTRDKLARSMRLVGLRNIARWKPEHKDCASLPISLNLEGYKRKVESVKGVVMTMTLPRLCFSDNMFCAMESVIKLRLSLLRSTGVFWSHGMTKVWLDALATNPKYILHVDYDSLYTADDIIDLFAIMEERPDIDALCAFQIHREKDTPLMAIAGPDGKMLRRVDGEQLLSETMPIHAGHFGLTMLRADKIAALPKPWFCGAPGENGDWGADRTDDDIWFWNRWREAGNTIHSANSVSIGHIQRVITWPNRMGGTVHQYMNEYGDSGKPLEAR